MTEKVGLKNKSKLEFFNHILKAYVKVVVILAFIAICRNDMQMNSLVNAMMLLGAFIAYISVGFFLGLPGLLAGHYVGYHLYKNDKKKFLYWLFAGILTSAISGMITYYLLIFYILIGPIVSILTWQSIYHPISIKKNR